MTHYKGNLILLCQNALIENGADVLFINENGETSFELATKTNFLPLFASLTFSGKVENRKNSTQFKKVIESFITFLAKNRKLVKNPMKYILLLLKQELTCYLDHVGQAAKNCWWDYLEYDSKSLGKYTDENGYNVLHFAVQSSSVGNPFDVSVQNFKFGESNFGILIIFKILIFLPDQGFFVIFDLG